MRINEKLQLRRESLKILASQIWIVFLSTTTAMAAAVPGHGSPRGSEYCEQIADPVRKYKASNIVKAEKALELAEKRLKRAKKKLEEFRPCESRKCHFIVKETIGLAVGEENFEFYREYLGGDPHCRFVGNSAIRHYNMYAQVYGWDVIQEETLQIDPQRTIAGDEGEMADGKGGGVFEIVPTGSSTTPEDDLCSYVGPDNTLNVNICENVKKNLRKYGLCKTCLGSLESQNKYGRCLKREFRLNQRHAEAENLVETRETERDNAEDNPSSTEVCTDCMQDRRTWWEKWGPTLLTGSIVGLSGYFAYRQERNSYKHYRDVIHENNNKLGYPTEPRDDLSGHRLAVRFVNGTPLVINTALRTGVFGCAGSFSYEMSKVLGGAQQGGATGYSSNFLNSLSGDVSGILRSGANGSWGTSPPSAAQIDATIRAHQESIERQQAELAILQHDQNVYQSRAAIEHDAALRIGRLPRLIGSSRFSRNQISGGYSNNILDGFLDSGLFVGGAQVNAEFSTYGNAGTNWRPRQRRSSTSSGVRILD